MITTLALANISVMSHNYCFVLVVRTFKMFSLSNFQVCNMVLLTIIYYNQYYKIYDIFTIIKSFFLNKKVLANLSIWEAIN